MRRLWAWWLRVSKEHPVGSRLVTVAIFIGVTLPGSISGVWSVFSDKPFAIAMSERGWGWVLLVTPLYGWFCVGIGLLLVWLVVVGATQRSDTADQKSQVTIFTHDEALRHNPALVNEIKNVFVGAGWWATTGPRTNLPQHGKGVWIHGGTANERTLARWGLRTLNIPALIDATPSDAGLQVIVGAEETTAMREDALKANVEQLTKERDSLKYSLAKVRRREAIGNISRLYRRTIDEGWQPPATVTIRSTGHGDFDLIQRIEKVFAEHARDWPVTLDGGNKPLLKPSEGLKVVFVSGLNGAFDAVAEAFKEGDLIGEQRIGRRSENRNDYHLVVEILPVLNE